MEQCVTEEMLRQCKSACSHYQFHLDEMKRESEETDRERKRKAVKEELEQTEKKKKKLDSTVTDLEREVNQLALDVEKQNNNEYASQVKCSQIKGKGKKGQIGSWEAKD